MSIDLRQIPADHVALDVALMDVKMEVVRAMERFAPFNSPHEGCAVIREELEELWEHAKVNTGRGYDARSEARQIAAMAVRYMLDLTPESQGVYATSNQDSIPAKRCGDTTAEEMRDWNAHIEESWLADDSSPASSQEESC